MKRLIALFAVFFCLTALLAGCNGLPGISTAGSEAGDAGESTYGPLSESVLKKLNAENFTMGIRTTADDAVTEMTLVQKKPDYVMVISADDQLMRVTMVDGVITLISDTVKTAINLELMQLDPSAYQMPEVAAAVKYLGSGKAEVDGKELPYEEYEADEEATARYFFDGDRLAYIVSISDGEETVMEILSLTDSIDESLFAIPDDYQRVETLEDLAALTSAG